MIEKFSDGVSFFSEKVYLYGSILSEISKNHIIVYSYETSIQH